MTALQLERVHRWYLWVFGGRSTLTDYEALLFL